MLKTAKGQRPVYLNDPQEDKMLAIIMALAGEVSVLRERLDTVERLLETKGILSTVEIENYQPDERISEQREQWRIEYIARILRILEEEIDGL
ncbi:MAG: hypothetical protein WAN66_00430 [Limnoraphis robusta]|uniref:Uncharacterized protein n=2 Tax=Limnoraphis robusta TaxID=1118279 RepID=A0A0F5YLK0_9CYAN|nr:hypothetical protein [Limnoraphis robusta]KKD39776.1 hypothetical protein WN50_01490 [Limnoraphis robusta CS-951]MEA5499145.1 hypothetical protein [Limnoraphis robusta BA-68 BA1]MEA5519835.1 hypothetical protein [Limnoraphis robusta CCNP1315]MEA5547870.1 hypothetical protein [Limnoraphis robusta CCNP1324]